MNYDQEFITVDLVMSSGMETSGVDAFALALIKAERQMRKLFTFLVFQCPCFNTRQHVIELRSALATCGDIYFYDFIVGIEALSGITIESLMGERYPQLYERLKDAINYRNKIFHGQLTTKHLSHSDFIGLVTDIKTWCSFLAQAAIREFGYDGFARNSFRKSTNPALVKNYRTVLTSIVDYDRFLSQYMRKKKKKHSAVCRVEINHAGPAARGVRDVAGTDQARLGG